MPTVYTLAQVVTGAHCAAGGAPSMAPIAAARMEDAEPVRRTLPPTGRRGGRPDLADGVPRQPHADRAPLLGLAGQVVHALLGQTLAGVQDERELARAYAAHISRACTELSVEVVLPAPASHKCMHGLRSPLAAHAHLVWRSKHTAGATSVLRRDSQQHFRTEPGPPTARA